MYGKNAHSTYKSVQITTTDRGRLLLMMYEGAIKFLKQSNAGLEEKDIPKFCRFLSKAQAIIAELMNTLDYEKGGEIAVDLNRLYDFMLFYLTEANLHRDGERERVILPLKLHRRVRSVPIMLATLRHVLFQGFAQQPLQLVGFSPQAEGRRRNAALEFIRLGLLHRRLQLGQCLGPLPRIAFVHLHEKHRLLGVHPVPFHAEQVKLFLGNHSFSFLV